MTTPLRASAPWQTCEPTAAHLDSWAEIDLDAVVSNARAIRRRVGARAGILAVVKSDAYGHGATALARSLEASGAVAGLVVGKVGEGLSLRHDGIRLPVVVMTPSYGGHYRDALAANLVPVIASPQDLEGFGAAARRARKRLRAHLDIDTGMARSGFRLEQLPAMLELLRGWPEIEAEGMCTHFAAADAADATATERQLALFERAKEAVLEAGHMPTMFHAANTAATVRHPRAHFTHVRPGIALYGGDGPSGLLLRPALRLCTRIAQLRTVMTGEAASYGCTWHACRPTRIATLPVGYVDGYTRRLSGRGEVLVGGRRCPIIGSVCMEMTLVDVTDLGDDVVVGDEVVLIGRQGAEEITAVELAERAGAIVEEILCGISKAVVRTYTFRSATFADPLPARTNSTTYPPPSELSSP